MSEVEQAQDFFGGAAFESRPGRLDREVGAPFGLAGREGVLGKKGQARGRRFATGGQQIDDRAVNGPATCG